MCSSGGGWREGGKWCGTVCAVWWVWSRGPQIRVRGASRGLDPGDNGYHPSWKKKTIIVRL